jgi:hypothetical protein
MLSVCIVIRQSLFVITTSEIVFLIYVHGDDIVKAGIAEP